MDISEYPFFRKIVIHCILSTDPKRHFADLAKFKIRVDSGDYDPSCSTSPHLKNHDRCNRRHRFLTFARHFSAHGRYLHPSETCARFPEMVPKIDPGIQVPIRRGEPIGHAGDPLLCEPRQPVFFPCKNFRLTMAKGELFFVANIVKPLYVEIDRF
jgi:hypothetical protein